MMDAFEVIKNDKSVQEFLTKVPEYIKFKFEPVVFPKNSIVIEKGAKTEYAFLILKGNLTVTAEFEDGNHYLFAHLKPFSFISDLEVLSEELINAVTVIAAEDSILLRLDVADFIHCLKTDHEFLMLVAVSLAKKMFQRSYETGPFVTIDTCPPGVIDSDRGSWRASGEPTFWGA